MKLKTFLLDVINQIREGASEAGCMPNPRVEMDVAIKQNGNIASSKTCGRVHITVLMLPNVQSSGTRDQMT